MTNAQMTPEQIVRRYYQLINDRQLEAASALVDQHAVYHYLPTRQRFVGRTGFHQLMAFWLNAFQDAKLKVLSVLPLNDHVVQIEFLGTGTHTGDLVLDESSRFPPTGRV